MIETFRDSAEWRGRRGQKIQIPRECRRRATGATIPRLNFTRESLAGLLRTRSGKLEETPYAVLLLAIAVAEETAVLQLRRNQLEKTVLFDDGAPFDCRSNIATEMFSRFLVTAGKLKAADEN